MGTLHAISNSGREPSGLRQEEDNKKEIAGLSESIWLPTRDFKWPPGEDVSRGGILLRPHCGASPVDPR